MSRSTPTLVATELPPLSINSHAGYKALPECDRHCVNRDQSNRDVEGYLECGDGRVYDTCFCREELRPSATAWLSLCVVQGCRGSGESYGSALNVYNDYCGFELATVEASSTGDSSTVIETTPTSRETNDASRESSTLDDSPSGHTSQISAGAIAGIVIGGLAVIMVGLGFIYWMYRKGQTPTPEAMVEIQEAPPPATAPAMPYVGSAKSPGAESYTHVPDTPFTYVTPTRTTPVELHSTPRMEMGG